MSRIQFNLLPDVKLQYLRTHRTKNFVLSICILASAASLTILVILLFTVLVVQKQQLSSSQKALNSANGQLSDISDLNKIVTVQNQLTSLVQLHQGKHASERIFDYLRQVTPSKASVNRLSLDMTQKTMSITGNADSQKTVNTFIDTLKFTSYKLGDSGNSQPAFSNVIETSFAINLLDSSGKPQKPTLSVPTLTTTRSVIDDPSNALFQKQNPSGDQ
jgi:Tfp pilus assembly protein PilN